MTDVHTEKRIRLRASCEHLDVEDFSWETLAAALAEIGTDSTDVNTVELILDDVDTPEEAIGILDRLTHEDRTVRVTELIVEVPW